MTMSRENKGGFGKFIGGLAIGAGIGLLFAPDKGTNTRKVLKKKVDELLDNKETQRIAERGKALKEKIPNLDLKDYTYRASKHLNNVRSKQNTLKKMFGGSNKYKIPLMLAMAYGGGTSLKSLYDRLT